MTRPRPRAGGLPRAPFWLRRPRVLEGATLLLTGLTLVIAASVLLVDGRRPAGLLAVAMGMVGVVLVRRVPVVGLVLLAACPLLAVTVGNEPIALWQVTVFGAFLLTLRGASGRLTAAVIGAADFTALALAAGTVSLEQPIAWIAGATGVAAAATGSAINGQLRYWSLLQATTHEAVAGRDAAVQRSVAEERLRIARDLHDTLGHEIAVMSMHLGAAEVRLPADADATRGHLVAARGSVQSLLAETQEILRVLGSGPGGDGGSPVASHHSLPDLVEKFRAAGMPVEAALGDLSPDLPPQVSAAAYRIAQEALTNAQRHGAGAVSLRVEVREREVTVEAVNPVSPGRPSIGGARGLVGMRERASAAGGRLEAGADGELFRVRAVLPVAAEAVPR